MPSSEAKLHLFFERQMFSTNNLLNDFKRGRGGENEEVEEERARGRKEEEREGKKEERKRKKNCPFLSFLPFPSC